MQYVLENVYACKDIVTGNHFEKAMFYEVNMWQIQLQLSLWGYPAITDTRYYRQNSDPHLHV